MILLDMKSASNSSSSSPLSLSTPSDELVISFSDLLRGVSDKKDGKLIQNGSVLLSLGSVEKDSKESKTVSKADTLLSLLKDEDTLPAPKLDELQELNPKLTSTLSAKEIKTLVADAKNYLKEKIENSDDYIKLQIKELPKTLKGLLEVAKKFGIDISKITLEEVKGKTESVKQEDIKTLVVKDDKEQKLKPTKDIKETPQVKDTIHVKETPQAKDSVHVKDTSKESVAVKDSSKDIKERPQTKELASHAPKEIHQDKKDIQKSRSANSVSTSQAEVSNEIKNDEKLTQVQKAVKETPLFKAQVTAEHTTTEQIVQAKANSSLKVEHKTPKAKADETLKLLLRGEKPALHNSTLTADFSVATAKVIAGAPRPSAPESVKVVENISHSEHSSTEHTSAPLKTEALTTHKSDSFEVKLNEAKQMIKYLSTDVKAAIEDYKSPFTRVKVQLNPQRLGEVDLTIVQRGKNLHVNISSNVTAVNTLAANAGELKVQLNNSGINNATLNFNNSSQNSDTNAGQQQSQQNRQNEKQAHEEYRALGELENEEAISSMEIIVPHYI